MAFAVAILGITWEIGCREISLAKLYGMLLYIFISSQIVAIVAYLNPPAVFPAKLNCPQSFLRLAMHNTAFYFFSILFRFYSPLFSFPQSIIFITISWDSLHIFQNRARDLCQKWAICLVLHSSRRNKDAFCYLLQLQASWWMKGV